MYSDITGIILAGGKSTRMGNNKSLLKIGELTVIERVVDLIKPMFGKLILITNTPDEYSFLDLEMHQDVYKNAGPLAGIHSGLVHSTTEKNFIISCDMPLMTREVITFLLDYTTKRPITIAKADSFIQQLCGVYSKIVIPLAEQIFNNNVSGDERNTDQKKRGCRVLELVKLVDAEIIDIEKNFKDYVPGTFCNMNTPAEFEFIKAKLSV